MNQNLTGQCLLLVIFFLPIKLKNKKVNVMVNHPLFLSWSIVRIFSQVTFQIKTQILVHISPFQWRAHTFFHKAILHKVRDHMLKGHSPCQNGILLLTPPNEAWIPSQHLQNLSSIPYTSSCLFKKQLPSNYFRLPSGSYAISLIKHDH